MLAGFSYTQNSFLDSCSIYYALDENVASVASHGLFRKKSAALETQDNRSAYEESQTFGLH